MSDETKLLEQSPGVKSSKRLFGACMVSAGGVLLLAVGISAIFRTVADPATALDAGRALIITGAALLGVGVLEGIGNKISGTEAGK